MHSLALLPLILIAAANSPAQDPATEKQRRADNAMLERLRSGEQTLLDMEHAADYVRLKATSPPSAEELAFEKTIQRDPDLRRSPFFASSVVGEIVVVEGSGGITYTENNQTKFNDDAIFDVANEVLYWSSDRHDMMVIFTTFAQNGANYAAYYLPMQNDIAGLGACNEQSGESHGCIYDYTGGLDVQGMIYMSSVGSWLEQESYIWGTSTPITSLDSWVYSGVGHETLHRWGSALRIVHPTSGAVSKAMLGESLAHWNAAVNAKGSMHYGWQWQDNGDGSYDLLGESTGYWDLDLYAMGVLPAADVEPWYMLENARSDELETVLRAFGYSYSGVIGGVGQFIPIPPVGYLDAIIADYYPHMAPHVTATGTRLDLTIEDVIAAEGARVPAYGAAPTQFKQAWVLVTGPDQSISQVSSYVEQLDTVRQNFEVWFSDRTNHRGQVCTKLMGECAPAQLPELEPRGLRFDDSAEGANGNGIADRGESIDFYPIARNAGDIAIHGAKVEARTIDEGLSIDRAEATLGDLAPGEGREASESILVYVDEGVECATPLRFEAAFRSDETAAYSHVEVVYPGFELIKGFDFEDGDQGWVFNPGGEDDAAAGTFARGEPRALYTGSVCATPPGQTSPGGSFALLTDPASDGAASAHDVDGGFTSVLSPDIDTKELKDPHLAYRYWHVSVDESGDARDSDQNRLIVELSIDGKPFQEIARHSVTSERWEDGLIRVLDHADAVPDKVALRVTQFDDGYDDVVEGGLDDVRLYDLGGDCAPEGCGCRAASPQRGALLALLSLLGLLIRGRGRR